MPRNPRIGKNRDLVNTKPVGVVEVQNRATGFPNEDDTMLQIDENVDELTLKGLPLTIWIMALGVVVVGISLVGFAVSEARGLVKILELTRSDGRYLVVLVAAAWCFIGGLSLFHFFPMTVTLFNRTTKTITQTKYTLLGKRTRRFGYSVLQSKVQCYSDTVDETSHHWLFFYAGGGERIYLTGHSFWSRETSLETANKVNEFLVGVPMLS